MNKSVMKCCICNNENIGQFITINNKKYHLCCIEQLQQENKILKENAENNDKVVDKVNWENMLLKKENKQLKDRDLIISAELTKLQEENQQLKDNWNKLKEYLYNVDVVIDYSENYDGRFINYDELVNKMQEIEGVNENGVMGT